MQTTSFRRRSESSLFNPALCVGLDPGLRQGDGYEKSLLLVIPIAQKAQQESKPTFMFQNFMPGRLSEAVLPPSTGSA